jgi:hypothetical protein
MKAKSTSDAGHFGNTSTDPDEMSAPLDAQGFAAFFSRRKGIPEGR